MGSSLCTGGSTATTADDSEHEAKEVKSLSEADSSFDVSDGAVATVSSADSDGTGTTTTSVSQSPPPNGGGSKKSSRVRKASEIMQQPAALIIQTEDIDDGGVAGGSSKKTAGLSALESDSGKLSTPTLQQSMDKFSYIGSPKTKKSSRRRDTNDWEIIRHMHSKNLTQLDMDSSAAADGSGALRTLSLRFTAMDRAAVEKGAGSPSTGSGGGLSPDAALEAALKNEDELTAATLFGTGLHTPLMSPVGTPAGGGPVPQFTLAIQGAGGAGGTSAGIAGSPAGVGGGAPGSAAGGASGPRLTSPAPFGGAAHVSAYINLAQILRLFLRHSIRIDLNNPSLSLTKSGEEQHAGVIAFHGSSQSLAALTGITSDDLTSDFRSGKFTQYPSSASTGDFSAPRYRGNSLAMAARDHSRLMNSLSDIAEHRMDVEDSPEPGLFSTDFHARRDSTILDLMKQQSQESLVGPGGASAASSPYIGGSSGDLLTASNSLPVEDSPLYEQRLSFEAVCAVLEELNLDWDPTQIEGLFKVNDTERLRSLSWYQFCFLLHQFIPTLDLYFSNAIAGQRQMVTTLPYAMDSPVSSPTSSDGIVSLADPPVDGTSAADGSAGDSTGPSPMRIEISSPDKTGDAPIPAAVASKKGVSTVKEGGLPTERVIPYMGYSIRGEMSGEDALVLLGHFESTELQGESISFSMDFSEEDGKKAPAELKAIQLGIDDAIFLVSEVSRNFIANLDQASDSGTKEEEKSVFLNNANQLLENEVWPLLKSLLMKHEEPCLKFYIFTNIAACMTQLMNGVKDTLGKTNGLSTQMCIDILDTIFNVLRMKEASMSTVKLAAANCAAILAQFVPIGSGVNDDSIDAKVLESNKHDAMMIADSLLAGCDDKSSATCRSAAARALLIYLDRSDFRRTFDFKDVRNDDFKVRIVNGLVNVFNLMGVDKSSDRAYDCAKSLYEKSRHSPLIVNDVINKGPLQIRQAYESMQSGKNKSVDVGGGVKFSDIKYVRTMTPSVDEDDEDDGGYDPASSSGVKAMGGADGSGVSSGADGTGDERPEKQLSLVKAMAFKSKQFSLQERRRTFKKLCRLIQEYDEDETGYLEIETLEAILRDMNHKSSKIAKDLADFRQMINEISTPELEADKNKSPRLYTRSSSKNVLKFAEEPDASSAAADGGSGAGDEDADGLVTVTTGSGAVEYASYIFIKWYIKEHMEGDVSYLPASFDLDGMDVNTTMYYLLELVRSHQYGKASGHSRTSSGAETPSHLTPTPAIPDLTGQAFDTSDRSLGIDMISPLPALGETPSTSDRRSSAKRTSLQTRGGLIGLGNHPSGGALPLASSAMSKAKRKSIMLQKKQIDLMLDLFSDDKGWVQVSQLPQMWERLGGTTGGRSIEAMKADLDPSNTGRIKSHAISHWWYSATKKQVTVEEKLTKVKAAISDSDLRAAFDRVDTFNQGKITFANFCYALEELNIRWGIDEAKKIFKKMDEKKTKYLDFEEFKQGFFELSSTADQMSSFWFRLLGKESTDTVAMGKEDLRSEMTEEKMTLEDGTVVLPPPKSMDEIAELIESKKTDWKERLIALRDLSRLLSDPEKYPSEEFVACLEGLQDSLKTQLNERRSAVSRACCQHLAEIISKRGTEFRPFIPFFVAAGRTVLRMTVQVMSDAADSLFRVMVLFIEEDLDNQFVFNRLIKSLYVSKFNFVRKSAFVYLCLILSNTEGKFDRCLGDAKYMDSVCHLISDGVNDQSADVRTKAFEALALVSLVDEARSEAIMAELSDAAKTRFAEVSAGDTGADGGDAKADGGGASSESGAKKKGKKKGAKKKKKKPKKKRLGIAELRRQQEAAAAAEAAGKKDGDDEKGEDEQQSSEPTKTEEEEAASAEETTTEADGAQTESADPSAATEEAPADSAAE